MAKRDRERGLAERRLAKQARKAARKEEREQGESNGPEIAPSEAFEPLPTDAVQPEGFERTK